jgi:hypothetical protein
MEGPYTMVEGDLILGVTNEWIQCNGFYPSLRDKSSMGRNFSTAINGGAGSGDDRFGGHYTLEIKSDIPLTLTYGMLIAQMIFHETVGEGDYNEGGRYANEFTGNHPIPEECKGFKNVFDIIKAQKEFSAVVAGKNTNLGACVVGAEPGKNTRGFENILNFGNIEGLDGQVGLKVSWKKGDLEDANPCVVDAKPEECLVLKKCYIYGIQDSFGNHDMEVVDFWNRSISLQCQDQNGIYLYFNNNATHLRNWCKENNIKYLFKEVRIDFNSSEFETL